MIKKHLLTKQKGIDSCSLLPQKWFVCLLTLLATFVGSSRMWADDAEFGFIYTLDNGSWVNPRWTTIENVTNSGEQHGSSVKYYSQQESKAFRWNGSDDTNATTYWRTGNTALTDFSDDQWVGYTLTPTGSGVLNISHVKAQIVTQGLLFNYKVKILNNSDEVLYESDPQEVQNYASGQTISSNFNLTNLTGAIKVRLYVFDKNGGTTKYFVVNNLQVTGNYQTQLYSYSIKTTGVGTQYTLASGTVEPNASVTVPYRRYFDVNGQLYEAPKTDDNKKQYNKTFTINSDNYAGTVDYADANVSNIVYLSEAEAISGMTETSEGNANVRCSDAKGAYAPSNVNFFTPAAGKYKIKGSVWGNTGTTFTIMAGDKTVWSGATTGSYTDYTSEEFSIDGKTPLTIVQAGDNKHSLDYVYVVKTGDYTPEVSFELNGGTGDATAPIDVEITLPTPTKAGYSFIGWMNAASDITPTAGYPGAKKTYTEATTLYALWYKNNCEIDFTSSGPLNGTPDKTGAAISDDGVFMAGGTPVGNITINGNAINTRFGVQTGTSWQYRNGGLYSNNSGGRAYGINGCLEGEYITINSSVDPNVNVADAELVSHVGNTYIYKVKKDGAVKFTPVRYSVLYSVAVASPCPHYVYTNGNVGASDELRDWWQNWSQFYKIQKGQTLNFKFTMHGGETSIDNWCLVAQTGTKHNGDLGLNSTTQEKLMVRANGYCWGTNGSGNATMTKNGESLTVNSGWTTNLTDGDFTGDNNNADVDIKVEYASNGVMTVTATTVANGRTYVLTKSSTAISDEILYLGLNAKYSWIEGITHPIKFADKTPSITTSANGTAVYEQHAVGNPEGTWVEYSIVGEPTGGLEASISQIAGSPDYTLSVKGKGTVTIKGTCGTNSDTYTLTVDGLIFQEPTPVYAKNADHKYDAVLVTDNHNNVTYKLNRFDTTEGLRDVAITQTANGCSVTGIPDDKGGIIVVRAERTEGGNTSVAEFCLTVPYDLHVWDMYHDPLNYGSIVEGNATDVFTGDDTQNEKHRVGSAHYVIFNSSGYDYKDGNDGSVHDNNRVAYNNWMDGQDYYAKENWYNTQVGEQQCNIEGGVKNYTDLRKYWKFTYKTCSYTNGVRTYVNEPLFAYKNPVIGDNGRIIKETAGLVFNSPALRFGVSDNDTKNDEGGTSAVREQDRCVLMQVGSSMTIPHVKKDRYVRIHWYRHSDNNGDRCTITNGIDLDGRKINPTDVIRFTGSHYYDDHKGSFVFKVGGDTPNDDGTYDVTISTVISGWTEIYRVEVMDKFDSELQLAEVDVANKITADQVVGKRTSADIGKPYATIDNWNSKDLNNIDNYNRSVFNEESANHPVLASRLVSKIRTKAKADAEGGDVNTPVTLESGELAYAPELYISGYPGHCFTWNGWMNTTLQAEFNGSARCKVETRSDAGWTQDNTIPADPVWVGNNIKYTMHPLKEVKGEGTIKLTLRTHSGREGEPHYTFDKREAIVAVGQYSVQEYPYTWDFTNYNFGLNNKYGSKTFGAMSDNNVNAAETKEYGHWKTNSENVWYMHAYQTKISGSMGGHTVKDDKKLNKPYFAQGAQLALGTVDDKHTILETEGLRVTIPALTTGTDLVKLVASDEATDTDRGYMTICSGGTITIPEVPAGMYVFVKSSTAPTSATHTTSSDVAFASNNDGKGNVAYYRATGDDVTLTFNSGATLYKIGVTDQVKDINAYGYSTESRKYDIDHNETRYFSANVSAYYVGNYSKSSSTVGETKVQDDAYVPKFTGVLLHDDVAGTEKEAYKIPLFVPACNITEDNTAEGNCMMPTTTEDNTTSNMSVPTVDGDYTNYTLTNLYGKVQNSTVPTYGSDHTIGFYKFYGGSMTQNKSYLHLQTSGLSETSKVKGFIFLPGSELEDDESTTIKTVEADIDEDAEYFTISGLKLNGVPTKSGVYIKNGQKVYVK